MELSLPGLVLFVSLKRDVAEHPPLLTNGKECLYYFILILI